MRDDAVLDGVLQGQHAALAPCLVADVAVLQVHTRPRRPASSAARARIGGEASRRTGNVAVARRRGGGGPSIAAALTSS